MEQRNELATHTFRLRETQYQTCGHGLAAYYTTDGLNATNIEAAITQFRYFDPNVPGTLDVANRASGTYSRDIWVDSVHSKFEMVNNYTVPIKIKLYLVRPKSATSLTPTQAMDGGLADQQAPANRSPISFPTDAELFNQTYAVIKSWNVWLKVGAHKKFTHSVGGFQYNAAEFDSEAASYQPRHKAFHWYTRLVGPIAHSTTTNSEIGNNQAAVDVVHSMKYVFKYDAGVELNDFTHTDNARVSDFTGAGVLIMKNVEHNQFSRNDPDA